MKLIINKDLLFSTGNSTQHSLITYIEKNRKNEHIYVYVQLNQPAEHLKQHNIVNQLNCSIE